MDDVRAIVQRAVKDLSIEQSLKKYEEVWLSKLFEMRAHVRNKSSSMDLQVGVLISISRGRAFAHGVVGCQIDPSWGGPIELFLVPASAP